MTTDTPNQTPAPNGDELMVASVTFPADLLAMIDERAKSLDMNRSQYLRWLSRQDLSGNKSPERPKLGQPAQPELMGVGK